MRINERENLHAHREHLQNSLFLLARHEPDWKPADRVRGLATKENLLKQMDEIDGKRRR